MSIIPTIQPYRIVFLAIERYRNYGVRVPGRSNRSDRQVQSARDKPGRFPLARPED